MFFKKLKFLALAATITVFSIGFNAGAYAGGGGDEGAGLLSGAHYVELDPIMLPIIGSNGVSQVINLVISLEVDSSSTVRKAERLQPVLTDAYIQGMYGMLARHTAVSGGALELSSIKKKLLKLSNNILSKDGDHDVKRLLIQMVDQRRI